MATHPAPTTSPVAPSIAETGRERIEFRIDSEKRRLLDAAAQMLGMSRNAFILMAAIERAARVHQEIGALMVVSPEDYEAMLAYEAAKPAPCPEMQQLLTDYDRLIAEGKLEVED